MPDARAAYCHGSASRPAVLFDYIQPQSRSGHFDSQHPDLVGTRLREVWKVVEPPRGWATSSQVV